MDYTLSFTATDLAQTRFAVSPMWEVVTSFRLLREVADPPLHRRWADEVRPRLAHAGLDRGWLSDLIPDNGYLADFLNPTPASPFPTLAAELEAIRRSPHRQVHVDIAKLKPAPRLRMLYEDPDAALEKITAEIETYWELALAPYWARIRRLLEADLFHRAQQVAEYGSAHVLNELHETVRWDDGSLRLIHRQCQLTRTDAGAGLLLVPSVFAWPKVLTRTVSPDPPQLAYPARGIGNLWEPRTTTSTAAVAAVLGRSRTLLLSELDTPASTTQLAEHAGMTAAGVSQHLIALRNAGLVTAHRNGRSVLYARTAVADALLA
jgi:DNA-binding transcriptional ArsR family regulator